MPDLFSDSFKICLVLYPKINVWEKKKQCRSKEFEMLCDLQHEDCKSGQHGHDSMYLYF